MEVVTLILLIVILYLAITTKSSLGNQITDLQQQVDTLKGLLKKALEQPRDTPPASKPATPEAPKQQPVAESSPRPTIITEEPKPSPVKPPPTVEWDKKVISTLQPPKPGPIYSAPGEPEPSFFESHPDLEKFIGENLINKIGIAILVLAIAYFVKFAIDNNWIGPVGRVGVGVLCGSILIGFAHRLRKNFTAFSSVLAGGGIAIYYFTITLAFQQFHLFSQTAAFIILIVITIFAVLLSLLYDKQELAIIALVGGMASPFMVSTGTANYHTFFIYLLVLNGGLLIIAYYKAWRILNISAFGLTSLLYLSVLYILPPASYHTGLLYGTIFYLLFLAINIANNVKEGKGFIASDYSILLINNALYFGSGLYLLTAMGAENYRGLFCAALGAINLALSYILFKNKRVDTNVLYLLIGITLTFISLTAPIQLHGHYITLFWASETVLLYWLFQKSGIKLMKLTALLVWLLMLASLGMDWIKVYSDSTIALAVIANKGFVTTLCAAVSTYLLYLLVRKDLPGQQSSWGISPGLLQVMAFLILFASGALEINHQFLNHYPNTILNVIYLMLYTPAFVWLISQFALDDEGAAIDPQVTLGLIVLTIAGFLALINYPFNLQRMMLEHRNPAGSHFAAHWGGAVFVGLLFYKLISMMRYKLKLPPYAIWVICGGIVFYLSVEVSLITNPWFYSPAYSFNRVEELYIQTALPVLWGLSSFAMMWLGMRYKNQTLRIISLSLFSLTLIKLFVFDIRNIPPAGKIAAFFCLGVLLLIVSFMYQKVKKIIVADEGSEKGTE